MALDSLVCDFSRMLIVRGTDFGTGLLISRLV
jgi:hypothetical protein